MEVRRPSLVAMCIDAAAAGTDSVETWRRQRRTLERLPSHLADALLRRLLLRRLVFPSLLEVFQHPVEEVDLKGESSVDAEWLAYLGAFRCLRALNLADCRGVTDSAIWPVSGMTSLKELDLSRCSKITDAGIRHLLSNSNLEKLYISETGLSPKGVMLLSSLTNLQVLDMGGIPVTDTALCSLQVLTGIKYLDIWGSEVSDVGARVLTMFPQLSFLNLAWTNVTKLPNLPSVKCLNMSNCKIDYIFYGECGVKAHLSKLLVHGATFVDVERAFSNVELRYITFLDMSGSPTTTFHLFDNMKGLEHLDLSFCKTTDDFMRCLADVGLNLRYLNLSNTKITSQGLCILVGHVPNLETLLLSHTPIDDVALSYIGLMPALKVIDISHTRIRGFLYSGGDTTDKTLSFKTLRNLNNLENLNLEEIHLRDEAVQPLASLRKLKCLYLKGDFLSDISLHALSSLRKLKYLGFRCAVVTDSGLLYFRPPPALCLLDLRGCWLLGSDIVSTFCTNHPGIEVRHEHISEHLQMLCSDQNGAGGSSSLHKTVQASQLKRKGVTPKMATQSPHRTAKITFVDERIKYSREELLEVQLLPLYGLSLCDIPKMLRKE